METLEAIRTRRSVRKFTDKPVEEEKIDAVLEAVRPSPSWANLQCWRLVVVKDPDVKKSIGELSYVDSYLAPKGYKTNPSQKGIESAPVVIVACADPSKSGILGDQSYYMTDMGIAACSLMLAAHSLGLGTVFVGVFQEEKIKSLLNIPSHIRVVGIFPIGYPLEEKREGPPRKPMNEIVFKEKWSG